MFKRSKVTAATLDLMHLYQLLIPHSPTFQMGGRLTRFMHQVQKMNERYAIDVIKEMQTKRCPIFWVLGGPCSGKTMLCTRIARRYNFHHINLDQLLREDLTRTDEWRDICEADEKMMLLPREYIIGLIQEEVQVNCFNCRGFLLEGYPRSVSQAEELVREVGPPCAVFYFHTSLHTMKVRLKHERPYLAHVGLGDEANYIKIYSFLKYFHPLLVQYRDKAIRLDTEGTVDTIFLNLASIVQRILKQKKIRVPKRILQ